MSIFLCQSLSNHGVQLPQVPEQRAERSCDSANPWLNRREFIIAAAGLASIAIGLGSGWAAKKKMFQVANFSRVYSLDPAQIRSEAEVTVSRLLYARLLKYDENWQLAPELAERFEISSDGMRVMFDLRRNAFFDDGRPITAGDVQFSLDRVSGRAVESAYKSTFQVVKGFKATDNHRLIVFLNKPYAPILHLFAQHFSGVVSRDWSEKNVVSSGPYRLLDWTDNQSILLSRNFNWDKTFMINEAGPIELQFVSFPEQAIGIAAFRAGDIDWVTLPAALARSIPETHNIISVARLSPVIVWLGIRARVSDARLRQAVKMAINVERIVEKAYGRQAEPVHSLFFGQDLEDSGDPTAGAEPNLSEAKKLMKEAGYDSGTRLSLDVLAIEPDLQIAELISKDLEELGIRLEVRAMPSQKYYDAQRHGGNSDMVLTRRWGGPEPTWLTRWFGEDQYAAWNWEGFNDQEFRRLHQETQVTGDLAKRSQILVQMRTIMNESHQFVFIAREKRISFHKRNVVPSFYPDGTPRFQKFRIVH